MRRPTRTESDEDSCCKEGATIDQTSSNNSTPINQCSDNDSIYTLKKDKQRSSESRFAKVKRIISGTLSLGSGGTKSQQDLHQQCNNSPSDNLQIKSSSDKSLKKSLDMAKTKSTRKRDRSVERSPKSNTSESSEIGLKLTKLVEYEIKLQQTKRESSPKNIRKRKEHHEIVSPPDQERKLIRSNSEERSLHLSNKDCSGVKDIRRVSSHEDFQKPEKNETEQQLEHVKHEPLHEINSSTHSLTSEKMKSKHISISDNAPLHDLNTRNSPNKISPNRDPKSQFFNDQKFNNGDFENEPEKHRTSERFSRPLAPRGRNKAVIAGKKRRTSKDHRESKLTMKIKEYDEANVKEPPDEKGYTISSSTSENTEYGPISVKEETNTLPLDLNTLHEQIDSTEPRRINSDYLFTSNSNDDDMQAVSLSCNLSSPRNSLILTRKVYLDPVIPIQASQGSFPDKSKQLNPIEARIKNVSKQINSLKKKLKKIDEQHDDSSAQKAERLSDKKVRGISMELNKLKKELKSLKSDPIQVIYSAMSTMSDTPLKRCEIDEASSKKRVEMIKETLIEVQKRLSEKRQHANRSEEISEMTDEQLIDEKVAVQKALLHLESIHGRPVSKEDRDVVRPLYDRYRILKRIVARTTNAKLNNSIELGTILEHEAMHFVSTPVQDNDKLGEEEEEDSPSNTPAGSMDSSDTDTSINENLHALSIDELVEQQRVTREEKKQIRRSLKEYEHDFELKTGRKLQKDDRTPIESTYAMYKQVKGKLKLIEVLIEKKKAN